MAQDLFDRRGLLRATVATALVAGLPIAAKAATRLRYDPNAKFELKVTEVEMRRNVAGRMLMARIYQPVGPGPFPVVLDLHGGSWNRKDRLSEQPMDRAIAGAGALVVAVDMTLSGESPYPACVQDANYAVRWLKANASKWNGDGSKIGVYGSSSGGHVAELLAMRPNDPRYNAIPLPGAPTDASVAYVAMRSPISNTFARYENAVSTKLDALVAASKLFFNPWESIHESNPQEIVDRRESFTRTPLLIMQGGLDDNVRPATQQKFVESYRAAGGSCDFTIYDGSVHEWVATPSPATDRAQNMVRAFIARHVNV